MHAVCETAAPKVLLVAENVSAKFGGQALIPLQYFRCLREMGIDVHLLAHVRTQKELLDFFPNDAQRLHFVADSFVNIVCDKIGKLMPDRLAEFTVRTISYLDTQLRQRRLARSLIESCGLNVVHEPIPVSPKLPSMTFGLPVPVIIGPMNGGMDYPPDYNAAGFFERVTVPLLRWTAAFWNRAIPGKLRAALLLVANRRTYDALPSVLKSRPIIEMVENGVDLALFKPKTESGTGDTLRIIYVGALIDLKRVDLLLSACARIVGKTNFRVDIVGDGPLREALEAQADRLSLTDRVHFYGQLPQSKAAAVLQQSDIMVHPSMRECGGAVVLEAMASSMPVIAADWGGPADYIDASTGILIPPVAPDVFVGQLADAILQLARDPQLRIRMGKAARQRIEDLYDWHVKTKTMLNIYADVIGRGAVTLGQTTGRATSSTR